MTGSLQIKNGKYYAVINTKDEDGKRRQRWISTELEVKGNKRNAERFLREQLEEIELQPKKKKNVGVLLSDYILVWLKSKEGYIEENTYQSYSMIANTHLVPYFKKKRKKIEDITREDIQAYIDYKYNTRLPNGERKWSAKTVKSHFVVLKQTFTKALKDGLIVNNPCEYISLPKIERYEPSFYTVDQVNALLSVAKNTPLYELIYFSVLFGLRRSEALGLKWDSINFSSNTMTIKHTVVRCATVVKKDRTKNEASYRSYPLSKENRQILVNLKKREEENRKLFGTSYLDNDYIFKWDNGSPYKPDYVSRKFAKILSDNHLPSIRFHDLRHSCASLLVAQGFALKDIQEWLGHSDIQTTANIYAHLDDERKRNISNLMTNSLRF